MIRTVFLIASLGLTALSQLTAQGPAGNHLSCETLSNVRSIPRGDGIYYAVGGGGCLLPHPDHIKATFTGTIHVW